MRPRKLTRERAARINRERDLIEGSDRSFETATQRVAIDHRGRGTMIDDTYGEAERGMSER